MIRRFAAVLLAVLLLCSFTFGASAGKPVSSFTLVMTNLDLSGATFNLAWNKKPVYRADVYLLGHRTELEEGGYIVGVVTLLGDGKVYRSFSLTGGTVAFGQNAGINPNMLPLSGKYCTLAVHLYDRKGNEMLPYLESNRMQIP